MRPKATMGPTNQALLALFRIDSDVRQAQNELDRATRGVRVQKKRAELAEQAHAKTVSDLKRARAQQMELDSDLKSRDEHIEHLRLQQQEAQNHKQYQAFLNEINTQKADRDKVEEQDSEKLAQIESLEKLQGEQLAAAKEERQKAEQLQAEIGDTTSRLEARIAELLPQRETAANGVPAGPRKAFERLADNYDGEALAKIGHIEGKEERYYCTACNMELVVDVYNRLRTRDDVVTCPGCGRILYIPEDLTPEMAIKQKKKTAKRATRAKGAKKTTKKVAKKDKKGIPADFKRVVTTAAAESLRQAELDAAPAVECEVRVQGVDDAVGPFRVKDRAGFARLIAGKVQAEDIDLSYTVVDLSASAEVGADVTIATEQIDGATTSPQEGVAGQVPSQPVVEPEDDSSAIDVEAPESTPPISPTPTPATSPTTPTPTSAPSTSPNPTPATE